MVFCGGEAVEYCYSVRNCATDKGWYRFFTTKCAYDMNAHTASNVHYNSIVYQEGNCGYDEITTKTCVICDLVNVVEGVKATGEHKYTDDLNCETALNCDVCKKELTAATVHKLSTAIVYKNGYANAGIKAVACKNGGCEYNEGEIEVNAIFKLIGYSKNETGAGLVLGFIVDRAALNAYNEISPADLEFGFVVGVKSFVEGDAPLNGDGSVAQVSRGQIIKANMTSGTLDYFDLKLVNAWDSSVDMDGDNNDETSMKDVELYMTGYVFDGMTVSYIDDTNGGKTPTVVTYASVK